MDKKMFYAFFIVFIVFMFYSNSFWGSFHYDDYGSIVENRHIRSLSPIFIFKKNNPFRFVGFYSFALNWFFFGLQKIFFWHLINIILHILCSLLVYFLILNVLPLDDGSNKFFLAFLGAIFFGIHPSLTETVNYIQARHILFLSFFILLILNVLFLYLKDSKKIYLFLFFLFSVFSIFSRETGIMYVFLIGSTFFAFYMKKISKIIALSYGFIFSLFGFCFLWFFRKFSMIKFADWRFFSENSYAFFRYLLFLIPYNGFLSVDHNFKGFENYNVFNMFFWPLLLFVYAVLVFSLRKKERDLSFFLLLPLFWHIPYLLIQKSSELLVEYKFYFMLVGFSVALSILLNKISVKSNIKKIYIIGFCILYILFAGKQTFERNIVWKNEISLWKDCVLKDNKNARGYCNLAKAYYDAGFLKLAQKNVLKSLKLVPDNKYALYLAGTVALDLGNYNDAVEYFERLVHIDRDNADAFMNLGYAFACKGKYRDALKCFMKTVVLDKYYAQAYYNMGNIWNLQGDTQKAVKFFEKAIKCKINFKPAIESLAYHYVLKKDYRRAYMFYYWAYLCDKNDKKVISSLKNLMQKIKN